MPLAYFLIDEKYLKDYSWFMRDHSMDHEVSLLANLLCGALFRLIGGAGVRARPDVLIGEPWNGDCVRTHHTVAWPSGVPRDQLQPLTLDKNRGRISMRVAHGEHPWRSRRPQSRVPGTVQLATLRGATQTMTDRRTGSDRRSESLRRTAPVTLARSSPRTELR